MSDHGYVYVLMNPSMKGLVKIGKTEREPEERAKELSSTTGVPTPFVVAYENYFESCSEAEIFVHKHLGEKGYRVSEKREFFEIPIKVAIDTLIMASNHFGCFEEKGNEIPATGPIPSEEARDAFHAYLGDAEGKPEIKTESGKWQEAIEKAEGFLYGLEENHEEALRCYLEAIKLGSTSAYSNVAGMFAEGQGVDRNINKALLFYMEGAKKGDEQCYFYMAALLFREERVDNAIKYWAKYFEQEVSSIDAGFAFSYICGSLETKKYEVAHIDKLKIIVDDIILYANREIKGNEAYVGMASSEEEVLIFKEALVSSEDGMNFVLENLK